MAVEDKVANFLAHYGVKGMKWGKRGAASKGKLKITIHESEDHKSAQKLKTKKLSQMSNKEIQDLNRRLQLEKTYKELNKTDSAFKKGKKFVDEINTAGTKAQQLYNLANSPMAKAAAEAVRMAASR